MARSETNGARRRTAVSRLSLCGRALQLGLAGAALLLAADGSAVPRVAAQEPAPPDAAAALEDSLITAIEMAEPSVVAIARVRRGEAGDSIEESFPGAPPSATDPNFIPNEYASGVVISADGMILTTYHVLGDPDQNDYYVWINRVPHKAIRVEKALAGDPWMDLAVLKIDAENLQPIRFGDAKDLRKGQFVIALGNPFAIARDGQASASWGIISNLSRKAAPQSPQADPAAGRETLHHYGTLIQTDAKLNVGASGGALVNRRGEMVGLLTALTAGPLYEAAAGFAIPVDEHFKKTVETLKSGRRADYGFLGVLPGSLTRDERARGDRGAIIRDVVAGTPADRAELRRGDVVLAVNNRPVYDDNDLIRQVSALPPEATVELTVKRNTQLLTRRVVLSKKAMLTSRPPFAQIAEPSWRGAQVEYATAMPSFYQQSRLLDPRGCIGVLEVERDSSAWNAGLRPGDYVAQVGRTRVQTPAEFFTAVENLPGEVSLQVYSGGRVLTRVVGP
jgi:serine protease Do